MNESAFPWQIDNGETMRGHKGMTLRDYFAAKAMQAYIQNFSDDSDISRYAYALADAMMKAREV
jgi:hypothetical protein